MKGLLSLLIFSMVLPAHAGIVIYGTRIIYPAENKEVMVQLMNQGNRSSLLQAWIDDGDTSLPPEKIQVPFMLTPPVAKIGANSGQQVKQLNSVLHRKLQCIFAFLLWTIWW
ncbi:fimbria/pilus periplasmic chaperone, partial [Escherichia sp. TWPC-MK]